MPTLVSRSEHRGKITLEFSNKLVIVMPSSHGKSDFYVEGDDYPADEIRELKSEIETARADALLTSKLSRRMCSVAQARSYLRQKRIPKEIVTSTIARFERAGFLDDKRFAEGAVQSVLNRNPAGRSLLIAKLREKRISPELAEDAVDRALEDTDETELAYTLLRKRWWRLRELDLEAARQKGYTFLARRGIRFEAATAAFERLRSESDDNQ